MQITITAEPKEIAALVLELQERQPKQYVIETADRLDRQTLRSVLRGETDGGAETRRHTPMPNTDLQKQIRRRAESAADNVERMQWRVLEMAVSKELVCDPVGTIPDERGGLIFYHMYELAAPAELFGGLAAHIFVRHVEAVKPEFAAYIRVQLERFSVPDDEQKELILHRIREAAFFGQNEHVAEVAH